MPVATLALAKLPTVAVPEAIVAASLPKRPEAIIGVPEITAADVLS